MARHGTIFVDETPFYATMGGQNGDIGVIRIGDGAEFVVEDTIKLQGGKIGHVGHVVKGMFKVGDEVTLSVDAAEPRRHQQKPQRHPSAPESTEDRSG